MTDPLVILIAIGTGVIMVAVIVVAFALVAVARQLRETLSRADKTLESAETELHLTLQELRDAIRNVNEFSRWLHKNKDKLGGSFEAVESLGEALRNTSDIIRTTLHPRLLSFGALLVGLKTGSRYLLRKILSKRR
jgi:uncharacterized protein YoxC